MKVCSACGRSLDESQFYVRYHRHGKVYLSPQCKGCDKVRISQSHAAHPDARRRASRKYSKANSIRRSQPEFWPYFVLTDLKHCDARHGYPVPDIDLEFVRDQLAIGCVYCGESSLRLTLDRIDCARGHTRDNVVPSCARCNFTRQDMPYAAWLEVAKGMRSARELGLFGSWTRSVRASG